VTWVRRYNAFGVLVPYHEWPKITDVEFDASLVADVLGPAGFVAAYEDATDSVFVGLSMSEKANHESEVQFRRRVKQTVNDALQYDPVRV
jgi:hypothetical protein